MKTQVLVLVSGSRCGKDTAADIVSDRLSKLGLSLTTLAYATFLKENAALLLGITVAELDRLKNSESMVTYNNDTMLARDFIKHVADVNKGIYGGDFYAVSTHTDILTSSSNVVLITDMRFKEEYESMLSWLEDYTYEIIFIHIDSNLDSCMQDNELIGSIDFDYTITNEQDDITSLKFDLENIIAEKIM